ncbi:heterokaryon incompatibility protein-domain-containing protein [Boeremia exigua]|uniref:heterokaryon incompatibility protein-domain-containing protein n=1 Tax=Boeremia exigua TaxID=749465 RepID=UPI001E8D3107|nr:heterokaryon incompatibility protein-domain-containing protein [Boeremia exigua]KAH6622235.1 heterokaryon incompatibility protein-domain-containing protein [Boeremia exigua]
MQALTCNGSDESYQYDTIPPGEFFRYLLLQPGSGTEPLKCSLHTTLVADTDYEAISYVWGTEVRDHVVSCDGRKLSITQNLHNALQRLRYPSAARRLWADSICVANMGQIYAKAQRVILYMVCSLLKDMRSSFDRELAKFDKLGWNLISYPSLNDPVLGDERWHSLEILLRLPWFKRGWVVREAGLARECLVAWGASEFTWTDLMWVVFWLCGRRVTIDSLPSSHYPLRAHIDAYYDRHNNVAKVFFEQSTWQPNRLLDYMFIGKCLQFKDRRDSIYAFSDLAIDSASNLRLRADYGQSNHEAFRAFATQYLRTTNDISILDYIVHGVLFDLIEFVTEPLEAALITPEFILCLWLRVSAYSHHTACYGAFPARAFLTILTRDFCRGNPVEWDLCTRAFVRELYVHQSSAHSGAFGWTGDAEHQRKLAYVHEWIRNNAQNKNFMLTKRGYMGFAPLAARQGDICGILFGCVYPCVLRASETGGPYQFVGPAYIQGFRSEVAEAKAAALYTTYTTYWGLFGTEDFKDWIDWEVEEHDIYLC